jgi:hypothetical protein
MVWFGSSGSSRSSPMGWVAWVLGRRRSRGEWLGAGRREAGSAGETRNPSSTRAHFSALVSAFQLGGRVVELVSNSV